MEKLKKKKWKIFQKISTNKHGNQNLNYNIISGNNPLSRNLILRFINFKLNLFYFIRGFHVIRYLIAFFLK